MFQSMHNKLQGEKSRLAVAVQACEAATACISRPSSPQDTMPAPIPHQELVVRARLEDLIDQVQSHLSGLTTTVSELEELQKQRTSLQEWIQVQHAAISEWASRPTKLRPEAAKQELNAMNELLNTIGDRRTQLLTELSGLEDDESDIEGMLNNLEDELSSAMANKQAGQNLIEDYRQHVQAIHGWFDNLLKKSETVDKGSGLTCAQKQAAIIELQTEFDDQGPQKLEGIKKLAGEVIEVVSNLDSQQVEEQVSLWYYVIYFYRILKNKHFLVKISGTKIQ